MTTTTRNFCFLLTTIIFYCLIALPPVAAQDDSDSSDEDKSIAKLVKELGELSKPSSIRSDANADGLINRQRRRVKLANLILDHEDASEIDFNFATTIRLQSLGIQFAISFRKKEPDEKLNQEYTEAIEEALSSDQRNIVFEATTASAGFRSGLYSMEQTEENAELAATAIARLNDTAPKDPLVQTTRRVMLEQVRNGEKPRLLFEQMKQYDEKIANIVLDNLDGKTDKKEAEFLWAKHFAKFGDFIAQRRLAAMYETGTGTRVNYSQASRWYKKLASLNDIFAIIKIGDFYMEGKGYFKNPETAVKNYLRAANASSRIAQFKLGECYRSGTGVKQDDGNWKKWIKAAAYNASGGEVQQVYSTIDFEDAPDSYRVFYETLIEDNPDDIYFKNNLAYSLLISSDKDAERALELVNEAIEDAKDDENFGGLNSFLDTKGTALKQLGKWKTAAKVFETILPEVDDKKPVLESLVECFKELDDDDKAKKFQKQLDELNAESESETETDPESSDQDDDQ